jgi:uncharacterized phosphatase
MNKQNRWAGTTETPLSETGRQQAEAAGQKIKDLDIQHIISSPLSRAKETAEIIAEQIGYPVSKIEVNPLFIERHFGEFEGKVQTPDLDIDSVADVETIDTILERAKKALAYLETLDYENILVVSHGSFGRALRHHLSEEFPYVSMADDYNMIPNAEVVCWI